MDRNLVAVRMSALGVSSDPAGAVTARVEPPGRRPIVVYGTVLPWLGSAWRHVSAGNGAAFAAAVEAQTGDWNRFQIDDPSGLVVAGDLNQDLVARDLNQSFDAGDLNEDLAEKHSMVPTPTPLRSPPPYRWRG